MKGEPAQFLCAVLLIIACASAVQGWAQNKPDSGADNLLKSIGLRKPALAKAAGFTLRDVGGATVSLSGYRGTFVLLNFWATWCGPCRDEMPSMEILSRNLAGQGFAILAVNQKESAARVVRFMKTHGLNFLTPLDSDGRVAAAYRVYGIPVSYLIDGNGNAIGMKSGAKDWSAPNVVAAFRELIGSSGASPAAGSLDLEPPVPLPRAVRAKLQQLNVYSRQDPASEVIAKIPAHEEAVLLGKITGTGEFWYMVRTKNGLIGWVRGTEAEEIIQRQ